MGSEFRRCVALVIEGMHVEFTAIEVFHAGAEAWDDGTSAAATNGAEAAFDQAVLFVLDDAAIVDIAIDGDDAIALGEEPDDTIRARLDPAGVVRCDSVSLSEGGFALLVAGPDRVKAIESCQANDSCSVCANHLLQPGELFFS